MSLDAERAAISTATSMSFATGLNLQQPPTNIPSNSVIAFSATATSMSFLLLPGEVRANVYIALFKNYRFTINSHVSLSHWVSGKPFKRVIESTVFGSFSLAILSTCRMIHNEAIRYLSSLATLVLTGNALPERSLASLLPPQYLQQLRLVLLPIFDRGFQGEDHPSDVHNLFKTLPALQCVEVADPNPCYVSGREIDGESQLNENEIKTRVLNNLKPSLGEWRNGREVVNLHRLVRRALKERRYSVVVHSEIVFADPIEKVSFIIDGESRPVLVSRPCRTYWSLLMTTFHRASRSTRLPRVYCTRSLNQCSVRPWAIRSRLRRYLRLQASRDSQLHRCDCLVQKRVW